MNPITSLLSKLRGSESPQDSTQFDSSKTEATRVQHPVLQDLALVKEAQEEDENAAQVAMSERIQKTNVPLEEIFNRMIGLKYEIKTELGYQPAELILGDAQGNELGIRNIRAGQKYLAIATKAGRFYPCRPALLAIYREETRFYGLYWYGNLKPYTDSGHLLEFCDKEELYQRILTKINLGWIHVES